MTLVLLCVGSAFATTYYISTSGNNANNGLSEGTPKLNITGMESLGLTSGDIVLFKRGDIWYDQYFSTNVPAGVTIADYGTGNKPIFYGTPNPSTLVWLNDAGRWYVENITASPGYIYYGSLNLSLGTSNNVLINQYFWNTTSNRTYINISKDPTGDQIYIPFRTMSAIRIFNIPVGGQTFRNLDFRYYKGSTGVFYIYNTNNVLLDRVDLLGDSSMPMVYPYQSNGFILKMFVKR